MTRKQALGMLRLHRKAEKAYKQYGLTEKAKQARAMRLAIVHSFRPNS